ncbi:uncharacterized protein C8R40DRAFT_1075398 [Lentinula edodes]|uniref:uncharacterized protein n=1 Tax=Lentinula edodes TaxID=5353 RepID=UPI001E8EAFF5|nr:uncharacterized protein C8R40DRAFT_1075398 [Lentinula edodes]KAH7867716.1 hypothetical protein C8R40DRAFT_1075398 [Lentinula edodes]
MPIVHTDQLRGGLDDEDRRIYHYWVNEEAGSSKLGSKGGVGGGGNATAESRYRWKTKSDDFEIGVSRSSDSLPLGGGLVISTSTGLLVPVIGVSLGTVFSTIGLTLSTFLAGSAGSVLTGAGIPRISWIMRTQNPRVGKEGNDEGGVDVESGEEGVKWIIGNLIMTI